MVKGKSILLFLFILICSGSSIFAGRIVGWGDNSDGKATPPSGNDYVAVAAGYYHSLAIKSDGSIENWGLNNYGLATPPDGNNYIAIAAGGYFEMWTPMYSLALKQDSSVAAWGSDEQGQCNVPEPNFGFIAVAAGEAHSAGLKSNGSIVCWGFISDPPVGTDYVAIDAGGGHCLALKSNGSIVSWGHDPHGQSTPPDGADFIAVATGTSHSIALKSDGSIVCWGNNAFGQAEPPAGHDYVAIAAGNYHSLALKSDGSIEGWGLDNYGQATPPDGGDYIVISGGNNYSLAISSEKWKNTKEAAEKRLIIWKSYYDPDAIDPNRSGWLNPDFWNYLENNQATALSKSSERYILQRNAIDDMGTLLTVLLYDSAGVFSNMTGAGNLCLATLLFGQLYETLAFNMMSSVVDNGINNSDIGTDISNLIAEIENEIAACNEPSLVSFNISRNNQKNILKQINWADGAGSSLDVFENKCLEIMHMSGGVYVYRDIYENLRHLIDSASLWVQSDHAYVCGNTGWKVRNVLTNPAGAIRSVGVGFMTQNGAYQIDSLYAALDMDLNDNLPEGWRLQQYLRYTNTSNSSWAQGNFQENLSTDYYELDVVVCDAIDSRIPNNYLRRDVCVLTNETLGDPNQHIKAYQYGDDWVYWDALDGTYGQAPVYPVPFVGGDASNTGQDAVYFGLLSGYIREVYWDEGIGKQPLWPSIGPGPIPNMETDRITALAIGHGLNYDDLSQDYDQPYQLYVGTLDGYLYYFTYTGLSYSWSPAICINTGASLPYPVIAICAGPNGGTKNDPDDGAVFALTQNAFYAYTYDESGSVWNQQELTFGGSFSGGLSVGMCGSAVLASFDQGLYAFTKDATGNWSQPILVDANISGRIVSDIVASGSRGAYVYDSNNIWNVIQIPNSKPKTPEPVSPADNSWLRNPNPTFTWTPFEDGGDGDTGTNCQLMIRCDTCGDSIVYEVNLPPSATEHTCINANLKSGRHYHWHVRYQDSSDDWSDWSSDKPTTHQDFKVTFLADFEPDGDVDYNDLSKLITYWLQEEPSVDISSYPVNDGIVNFSDFAKLAYDWLKTPNWIESSDYYFVTKWGREGTGDGEFDRPLGVTTDSNGNVYVADAYNDRIQKFTGNGDFLTEWGQSGSGNGQFDTPRDIAVDSSGFVYVTDNHNHRIQKFTSNGDYVTKWGSYGDANNQFKYPSGIAVGPLGFIYVSDYGNHRVLKFTNTGDYVTHWGGSGTGDGQFRYPIEIAVDSSGYIYVADADNHRVQKWTSNGVFVGWWGGCDNPSHAGSGHWHDPDSGHQPQQGTGDGQFTGTAGVGVDSSGNVYVTDQSNRFQKFDSSGGFIGWWGGCDDPSHAGSGHWHKPGNNHEPQQGSGDGQFNYPVSIDVDSTGNVYVTDYYNYRIQKFSPICEE